MQINLTPDPSLLAIMVIFLLNYLVVRRFFLQPINQVLEERETETRTAEQLHEDALARFKEATGEMENRVRDAKREASLIRDRFRSEAGEHRNAVIEKTHGQAKQMVGEADAKLAADVAAAREKIVRESDALARLAAERILGRSL